MNSLKFSLKFKAMNCVVNGDPNNEAQQRVDDDGHGYITDVCFNHFLRQYIAYKGHDTVFDGVKTTAFFGGMSVKEALEQFVDIRLFGAMLKGEVKEEGTEEVPAKKEKKEKGKVRSKEEKAGDADISVTRAFNMTICRTTEPIAPRRNAITRCMKSRDDAAKNATMGSVAVVDNATFALNAVLSGRQAEKNGVTEQDVALLKEAMVNWTKTLEGPRSGRIEIVSFNVEECEDNLVPAHIDLSWAN
jgi:CRISPR/Cas system type I-B associated protein Csh2 (Cas7 group RAMP superfamily)